MNHNLFTIMNLHEALAQAGYRNIEQNVLDIIERLLEKSADVKSLENEREEMMHEISRLNVERSKLKKEKESVEESLRAKQQWFADLEQAKSGLDALTEKESALNKDEMEMKQRYSDTKRMVEELQQNRWLSSEVRESIKKIWAMLPVDELDKALTK